MGREVKGENISRDPLSASMCYAPECVLSIIVLERPARYRARFLFYTFHDRLRRFHFFLLRTMAFQSFMEASGERRTRAEKALESRLKNASEEVV